MCIYNLCDRNDQNPLIVKNSNKRIIPLDLISMILASISYANIHTVGLFVRSTSVEKVERAPIESSIVVHSFNVGLDRLVWWSLFESHPNRSNCHLKDQDLPKFFFLFYFLIDWFKRDFQKKLKVFSMIWKHFIPKIKYLTNFKRHRESMAKRENWLGGGAIWEIKEYQSVCISRW